MAAAQFPSPSIGDLPPLPQIQGDDLRKRVFTHRSFHGRPAQTFEDPLGDISPDNEKLEHLGDSVLNLAVTTLLEEMYPGLKVGPASKVRARIVENAHLAQLSVKYALPEGLHVHTTQAMALRNTPSIAADLFEAYIGGVYTEQGFAVVQAWLQALLRPHAAAAYDHIRAQHGLSPAGSAPSTPQGLGPTDGGHLAFFNQQLQVAHRHVEWRDLAAEQALAVPEELPQLMAVAEAYRSANALGNKTTPVWGAQVFLDGTLYGHGIGNTKRAAKNEAAKQALSKLGFSV